MACSRFFGGKEFEVVGQGATAGAASLAMVQRLVDAGIMALPSFTDSGGPVPRSGGRGRLEGSLPEGEEARASLAALYCGLMVSEQLDAICSHQQIIIDGPFTQNPVLMAILGQLRPAQTVSASALRDGTTAGAAAIALIDGGRLPSIALKLTTVPPSAIAGLDGYRKTWRDKAYAHLA